MSFSDAGSLTTNLSLGERPVCGDVTATNGPIAANSPSPRRDAAFMSSGAIRFQLIFPLGSSPCLDKPTVLSRCTVARSGLMSVAIRYMPQFVVRIRSAARPCDHPARLGVHHRDGRHVHDVLHICATLEHMYRTVHSKENRTNCGRSSKVVQQLVRNVACAQVREDQHIRALTETAEWIRRLEQLFIERCVGLHLPVHYHRCVTLPEQLHRFRDFLRFVVTDRPEVGE